MKNTFAAISTGLTNSGISIVRMCGSNAVEIIDRVFKAKSGKKINVRQNLIQFIMVIFIIMMKL